MVTVVCPMTNEVPVMVSLRLFLPESWTGDVERMERARVPPERQVALTKPEIAIEEIDRVIASGARFGCVLADAGYGSSGPFRQGRGERQPRTRRGHPEGKPRRACPGAGRPAQPDNTGTARRGLRG